MITANIADLLEERENLRQFAATLPVMEQCRFSCHYIPLPGGREFEGAVTCEIRRNGTSYEAVGSSDAAAYGRMIAAIIAREG